MKPHDSEESTGLHAQIAERDRRISELEARIEELESYGRSISHDLKSPLVTILGFLSFLRRDAVAGDRERIDHDIGRIQRAADQILRLIDDLPMS
ncbi:MAG: hypothetical protein GY719_13185 [bacterium]|nr:hypothetical protein [bacterium]